MVLFAGLYVPQVYTQVYVGHSPFYIINSWCVRVKLHVMIRLDIPCTACKYVTMYVFRVYRYIDMSS